MLYVFREAEKKILESCIMGGLPIDSDHISEALNSYHMSVYSKT